MDQIEPLFPIPLLRSPRLLSPELNEAAVAAIRSARIESNLRSDQLFHTEVADPRDNNLFRQIAELTVPKLVEFGVLLFGERLGWMVKEMWTNMLETGGNQTLHSHANSFVSGIIYLTPSHPACKTVFVRPPGGFDFSFRHHTRSAAVGPFNAGNTFCPRPSRETSCCFRAISITRCRETRASSASRSPSTRCRIISIAGAIASASRLDTVAKPLYHPLYHWPNSRDNSSRASPREGAASSISRKRRRAAARSEAISDLAMPINGP